MSKARHHKHGGHHGAHHKHGGKHHKKGGSVEHEYNAEGTPAMAEAHDEKDEFKRGGHHKKRKHGGKAEGHKPKHRADRMPRRAAGGRSPLSTASNVKGRPGGHYDGHPDSRDD